MKFASKAVSVVVAAVVCIGAAGCGGSSKEQSGSTAAASKSPATMTVSGTLDLAQMGGEISGPCQGRVGFTDLAPGASVTVYDSKGEAIGLGQLGPGAAAQAGYSVCRFPFTVPDVPSDGSIYSVEIAHRGRVNFSKVDAQNVAVSLKAPGF